MTTNTCAVHVHMSKKAFTTYHLYKFIDFINIPTNITFINKIAGRDIRETTYCSPFIKPDFSKKDNTKTLAEIAKRKNNCDFSRYTAVNLSKENTVEVRIFNGTMEPQIFFSYIEFLYSLFLFTKENSLHDCTVKNYKTFIKGQRKLYTNIYNRI